MLCDSCEVRTECRFHFVVLSTLLQDILHPSHHLLNVFLQIANKLGLSKKKFAKVRSVHSHHLLNVFLQIANKLGLSKKNLQK
jgi:predicted house-cleaning noncanonical NTP pyrophosphatase (MazG superfamily)